jgi:protoporphyrinogen oxidase
MEAWYGGQASDMQLMEFTRDEDEELSRDDVYCKEGDFLGPHCVLRHGMKTVLEPLLANGGAERVRCEQEVIRIEETSDNTVLVETKTGLSIEADCCVVTMPVGCLKDAVKDNSSMFTPKLSEEKVEVCAYIHSVDSYWFITTRPDAHFHLVLLGSLVSRLIGYQCFANGQVQKGIVVI